MLISLLEKVDKIYIAYGATDFRKEINSLCNIVINIYGKNPYDNSAYIFCNKKRTSIKILSYDKNGFILAQKTLVQANKMKFQWPRNKNEMKNITKKQLEWLLSGLKIYPEKYFREIDVSKQNIAM